MKDLQSWYRKGIQRSRCRSGLLRRHAARRFLMRSSLAAPVISQPVIPSATQAKKELGMGQQNTDLNEYVRRFMEMAEHESGWLWCIMKIFSK